MNRAALYLWIILISGVFSCKDNNEVSTGPEVSQINPSSASAGILVSISGAFFSGILEENTVSFNGKVAIVVSASSTELNVVVPAGATTGPITVVVNGHEAANQPLFTVEALPTIVTSVNPMSGGYNTQVTITGSNFLASASDNIVTFNGVAATIKSVTANSLTVGVPVRSGPGRVVVNGVDSGIDFIYFPDIFVVGYEVSGTVTSAKVWKNGITTVLSKPGEFATANGIAFYNDNIYIAGYALQDGYTVARYWKNFVETPLPGSDLSSTVNSVSVAGSDVYLVGSHAKTGATNIAGYWKNESVVEVEDDEFPSFAKTHTIVGDDIYLGGGQFVNGANVATYWKNGKPKRVSEIPSLVNGIFVKGDDIYLVGYEAPTPTTKKAVYWKNGGEAIHLTSGAYQAEASAVVVVGNDIYITGYEHNADHFFVAKYWKNGVVTELTDGTNSAYTTSIDVLGNDVYIAGAEHNGINASVAKYWKNGISFPMTNGGRNAFAYDIVLR